MIEPMTIIQRAARTSPVGLLVFAFVAQVKAQTAPPAGAVTSGESQPVSSELRLPQLTLQADTSQLLLNKKERPNPQWFTTFTFDPDASTDRGGFGPRWHAKATTSFSLGGGFQLFASVVARRGYDMPLFIAESLGSDIVRAGGTLYREPRTMWDTEIRVKKRVKANGRLKIDVLGEALNFVNVNRRTSSPTISPTLTSWTWRFGVVLRF